MSKFAKGLHRDIEAMGYALVRQRKHMIYQHPCGVILAAPKTPSDHHAVANCLSTAKRLLRQAGVLLCPATPSPPNC